jgi:general secretion pathway protein G
MGIDRLHVPVLPGAARLHRGQGYTLLELLMALTVVALLAAIAVPSYGRILDQQKIQQGARDLRLIGLRIENYRSQHGNIPNSLNDLNMTIPKDPWGRAYRFLSFSSGAPGISGMIRKDHNLHPLNSEFDLYSMGADGGSKPPLTAPVSRDDIVWARDGDFVGLAADF